ncbi:hypothetical protein RFI_18657, partial [Reticulomyxa filosa]
MKCPPSFFFFFLIGLKKKKKVVEFASVFFFFFKKKKALKFGSEFRLPKKEDFKNVDISQYLIAAMNATAKLKISVKNLVKYLNGSQFRHLFKVLAKEVLRFPLIYRIPLNEKGVESLTFGLGGEKKREDRGGKRLVGGVSSAQDKLELVSKSEEIMQACDDLLIEPGWTPHLQHYLLLCLIENGTCNEVGCQGVYVTNMAKGAFGAAKVIDWYLK